MATVSALEIRLRAHHAKCQTAEARIMSGKNNAQGPPNKKTYVDSATGRKVNDYIPKFISSTPWYYANDALKIDSKSRKRRTDDELYEEITNKANDRLKHQRLNPDADIIPNNEPRPGLGINDEFKVVAVAEDQDFEKKIEESSRRKKIREWKKKGRCENCGGKHPKSECLEKPHSVLYAYRGKNDRTGTADKTECFVKEDTDKWDTKRDRWRGIDIDEEYAKVAENLKKKEEKVLHDFKQNNADSTDAAQSGEGKEEPNDTDILIKAMMKNNPLAQDPLNPTISRVLDEKPRYLEVIKTGEQLRYNPKSRVYKDLKEGYLNERGQFIPYLTGEAAEFEKMKKFARTVQSEQKKKWVEDRDSVHAVTEKQYATEISPTTAMLKMKEKEERDKIVREAKRKELLEKYGAL